MRASDGAVYAACYCAPMGMKMAYFHNNDHHRCAGHPKAAHIRTKPVTAAQPGRRFLPRIRSNPARISTTARPPATKWGGPAWLTKMPPR